MIEEVAAAKMPTPPRLSGGKLEFSNTCLKIFSLGISRIPVIKRLYPSLLKVGVYRSPFSIVYQSIRKLLKCARKIKIRKAFVLWKNRLTLEEILVLGDSHANVFNHASFRAHFNKCFFNVIAVSAATVSGL